MDGTRSIDEDAFEALLAGRSAPAHATPLQVFTLAVRAASAPQGRASADLAELIATGRLTAGEPSARTADHATEPARAQAPAPPTRRRPTMLITNAITAALAKVAAAGTIAQATAGVALVAAGVTGVGAAGVLPAPAQARFSAVVQHLAPGTAPAAADTTATDDPTTADESTDEPTGTPTTSPTSTAPTGPATGTTDPAPTQGATSGGTTSAPAPTTAATAMDFGSTVSADARDGGVDGQAISQQAHARNEARATARTATPEPTTTASSSAPATSAPTTGAPATGAPATGQGDGHGRRASHAPTAAPTATSPAAPGHSHP